MAWNANVPSCSVDMARRFPPFGRQLATLTMDMSEMALVFLAVLPSARTFYRSDSSEAPAAAAIIPSIPGNWVPFTSARDLLIVCPGTGPNGTVS